MHYQHTLKFASKSYFHNFRVNHTQDQSLSDNTHDFNDKIHVKPIDKKYTCNNRYLFVPISRQFLAHFSPRQNPWASKDKASKKMNLALGT